jgi:hypothetical protein
LEIVKFFENPFFGVLFMNSRTLYILVEKRMDHLGGGITGQEVGGGFHQWLRIK